MKLLRIGTLPYGLMGLLLVFAGMTACCSSTEDGEAEQAGERDGATGGAKTSGDSGGKSPQSGEGGKSGSSKGSGGTGGDARSGGAAGDKQSGGGGGASHVENGGGNGDRGGAAHNGGAGGVGGQKKGTGGSFGGAGSSDGSSKAGGVGSGGTNGAGDDGGGASGRGGTSSGSVGGGGAGGGFQGTLRIMPVGDSITRSTCYRAELWKLLNGAYPSRFDFVGTLKSDDSCNVPGYDQDNQGYGSALVTESVAGNSGTRQCQPKCPTVDDFKSAFSTAKPDVVLLHFATNDAWNNKAPADILTAYETLINAARGANSKVILLVAQIIPMNVTATTCSGCSCASCASTISALNSQITTWAPGVSKTDSPVIVVDQWTGFDATTDTRDGVHPNASGSQKMAQKWFDALKTLF